MIAQLPVTHDHQALSAALEERLDPQPEQNDDDDDADAAAAAANTEGVVTDKAAGETTTALAAAPAPDPPQSDDPQQAHSQPAPGPQSVDGKSPMLTIIRSKGFVWLSTSNHIMYYWAQAGKTFELKAHAVWWSCTPHYRWPTEEKEIAGIKQDFGEHNQDQRQAIVFIGVKMDEAAITKLMDSCLLNDEEFALYQHHVKRMQLEALEKAERRRKRREERVAQMQQAQKMAQIQEAQMIAQMQEARQQLGLQTE